MPKVRYNFTIEEELLNELKLLAAANVRPVSNYLEWLIKREVAKHKKK